MQPLLSLCVTTRNRIVELRRLIAEVLPELGPDVEFIIVDGASSDGTPELLKEIKFRNQYVRYYLEQNNSGLDHGYDKSVTMALGEYCWLLSDDDHIVHGAVREICDLIRSSNYDLFIINSDVWDSTLSRCLVRNQLNIKGDIAYTSCQIEELFKQTATVLSFIGSVVIRRSEWLNRDRKSYYGSWFVHVGVIFQKCFSNGVLVVAKPFVNIRYGVSSWSGKAFDIWMNSWPSLIWSLHTISNDAKRHVVPMDPAGSIFKHLYFNCHQVKFKGASKLIPDSKILAFIIRLIYCIPPSLCNAVAGIACYITSKKRLLMLYDLANCPSSVQITRYLHKQAVKQQI